MATKFVTNLDLNQNQLLNGRFESLASDPSSNNFEGRLIYNSTEKVLKVYDGSGWRKAIHALSSSTTALVVNESNGSVSFSIANAVASGASGLLTGSDKQKLDDAAYANTGSTLALRDSNGRLQVSAPVNDLDAANKSYVDAARTGLDVKASVRAATTENLSVTTDLEDGDIVDGVTLATGDRVLVKDQTSASENGIYIVQASGAAIRATDADSASEVTPGMFTFVEEGDQNADSGWVCITDGTITIGSTAIEFALFSVAGTILAGDALSKTGDTLNVNVDGTSIEVSADALRVASGAAGDGLGYLNGVLSVNAGNGITISGDAVTVLPDPGFSGLTSGESGLYIDSSIAGDGLGYTSGVLNVNVANDGGIQILSDALGIKLDAGVSGLATSADGLALDSSIAGSGIVFTDGVLSVDLTDSSLGTLDITQGGTSATTASGARDSLAATPSSGLTTSTPTLARISAQPIGDGSNTSFQIQHNFNTRAVIVQVFDNSTWDTVIADVARTTADYVTVSFASAPSTGAYTVMVAGM
jgi:hypothetical protein